MAPIYNIRGLPSDVLNGNRLDGRGIRVLDMTNVDISAGRYPGFSVIHKFGRNPNVSTTQFDAIWNGGGQYTGFNATEAELVTVVSSDANDTILGTGLRTIRLYGLDSNGLEQTEDVELNGLTSVLSTKEYLRLDRAKGLSAGSVGHNIGDITIAQSITIANIFAVVPTEYNSTMIAAYTIPSNKTGYIVSQSAAISNKQAAAVDVRLKIRGPGSVFTVSGEAALNSVGTGFIERNLIFPAKLPSGTDLFIEAEASASCAVSGFLDILLIDNE